MLDQNTDRMWYVIGAVILGASLIFLMNNSFPNIFASVADTFTAKTEELSGDIHDIGHVEVGDGVNLIPNSNTFGPAMNITVAGGAYFTNDNGGSERVGDGVINQYTDSFKGFVYPSNRTTHPDAAVYINNVFAEADTYHTFSFMGDRYGWGRVKYDIYYGETLVDSVNIGNSFTTHVITAKAPKELTGENYIKIKTTHHSNSDTEANAFWMYHPKLELGKVVTPYSK